MNSIGFLETVWRDMVYALRTMRKYPAFAVTAVVTLALGIGGNTAMFSVTHAVLLKPLTYRDPDRLVNMGGMTPVRYQEIRTAARFSEVGAFGVLLENMTLSGTAEPEALHGARVSANFLRVLGVEPVLGRSFLAEGDTPGGPPVALISAELWKRRFGGHPLVAGKTAVMDSTPYTIIGVLPAGFQFPFTGVDVWVTKPSELSVIPPQSRAMSGILEGFARLKRGVSLEQAGAELTVLSRQYAMAHPEMVDARAGATVRLVRLKDRLVTNVRSMLWMLFGSVGFVLLIACANVASLLLARATSRSREFAVRAALGAARGRLVRQLLAESLLLALMGGALGVLLARWMLISITRMMALDLPRVGEVRLDGMVLRFALLLSIVTGVLFGLAPSLGASRVDLAGVLRASGESANRGGWKRGPLSARGVLVIGQVALSVVLLIGAALLLESMARLRVVDPGFQPANLLTMQIGLPPARYDTVQKRGAFFDELVRRVQALPGVRNAALMLTLPTTGWAGAGVQLAEQPPVKLSERPIAIMQTVTPGYFRTLEIPLRRGREFTVQDIPGAAPVVIINESFARQFWPAYPRGQDPVGRHILAGANSRPLEIVGIVADVHDLDADARRQVYRPCAQNAPQSAVLAVRTDADPRRFVNSVRSEVLSLDRDQPVSAVKTMEDVVDASA